MIKFEALENLCDELHEHFPNREEAIARLKAHPRLDHQKDYHIFTYIGWFGEIHLDLSLEEIAEAHPELGIDFEHSLSEGHESEDYNFFYDKAGRLHADHKKLNHRSEYDKVIFVDGKPVLLEIAIRRWEGKGPGLKHRFKPEKIKRKLDPLVQFFKSDVGYVRIIPQDMYHNRVNGDVNTNYGQFQQNNGLVVPFYTDRLTFMGEVRQVVQDYGLKLKPQ